MKPQSRRVIPVEKGEGALLIKGGLPHSLLRELEQCLSYTRVRTLWGEEARAGGSNVEVIPINCFTIGGDPDGILPPQFETCDGYLPQVLQAIRKHGFRPAVIHKASAGRPEVFQPQWDGLEDVKFRWKQKSVLKIMLKHECGRIDCPPGWGKSFLVGQFCRLLPKAKIDVTCASADVIRQLYEYFKELGLPSVGLVGAGKREYDRRVTCYCSKSLKHGDGTADVLIADEVHQLATDDYMMELAKWRCSRRFGFSASHDKRHDGADFELAGLFGPVRMSIPYQEAVDHRCVVPIEVRWNSVSIDRDPVGECSEPTARERRGIWRNTVRNKLIAERARAYSKDPREQVLVVVDKIEHAMFLKKLLPEFTLCYGELDEGDRRQYVAWGLIPQNYPRMTLARRLMLKKAFSAGRLKRVIATGVWNCGVDFRGLGVLIRTDAKASPIADIQVPGRLSRTAAAQGKKVGIVEDFMDEFNNIFFRHFRERQKSYSGYGWKQHFPGVKPRRGGVQKSPL